VAVIQTAAIQSAKFTKAGRKIVMSDPISHFQGRYLGIYERDDWEFASRTNAHAVVIIAAVDPDDRLILVEQYRIPVQNRVIELPAGLVGDHGDPDEPLLLAAQRELEEETGFRANSWSPIMECPTSAGMCDEMLSFYLARDLVRSGPGGGDESEDIVVHEIPVKGVSAWLDARRAEGYMVDPKIYSALYWLSDTAPAMVTKDAKD
jgi:ADP-ribose pyrophosphatase